MCACIFNVSSLSVHTPIVIHQKLCESLMFVPNIWSSFSHQQPTWLFNYIITALSPPLWGLTRFLDQTPSEHQQAIHLLKVVPALNRATTIAMWQLIVTVNGTYVHGHIHTQYSYNLTNKNVYTNVMLLLEE